MTAETAPSHRPVAVDLFAGAGGLSLGFEMAGFDVLTAVEYDPVHAATHLYNFPKTPVICRDIRKVDAKSIVESARKGWHLHNPDGPEWDGTVDVIIGGPSCQGFSSMGKQALDDDRNQLIGEFVRLVVELRPRFFVMENVPGLLAPQFSGLLGEALSKLREAGYTISNECLTPLDATEFGVPQRRKRVFVTGSLAAPALSMPKKSSTTPITVKEALEGLPSLATRSKSDGELLELDADQYAVYSAASNTYLVQISDWQSDEFSQSPRVLSGCLVTDHRDASVARFSKVEQGGTEKVSRAWRLRNDAPARTLRAGTGRERGAFSAARPLHPTEPRVITIREAARLHSFPDWFRFHTTNWHGHRQIGNSVPPLLAMAVGQTVIRALRPATTSATPPTTARASANPDLLRMSPSEAAALFDAAEEEIPAKRQRRLDAEESEPVTAGSPAQAGVVPFNSHLQITHS